MDTRKRGPGHVLSISAENPVFEAALAAALIAPGNSGFGRQQTECRSNVEIGIRVRPDRVRALATRLSLVDGIVPVLRPVIPVTHGTKALAPDHPGGPFVTTRDVAHRLGLDVSTVIRKIQRGEIESIRAGKGGVAWYLIPLAELDRIAGSNSDDEIAA